MPKTTAIQLTKPESVGLSTERLARLKPALQSFIDREMLPNAVMYVAREGKPVYFEALGYQDCAKETPAATDTIFRLYSNSKALTGLATMILYEEGKLTLDDPVSKFIPAFKNPLVVAPPGQMVSGGGGMQTIFPTIAAHREITVRDCLRNTTGLATPLSSPYWFLTAYKDILPESGWDLMQSLDSPPDKGYRHRAEMHARLPLNFHPGTDFVYHAGYPVMGAVIEEITGNTLEEFYQERIFKPLGMKDTSFFIDKKKIDRFTCCYIPQLKKDRWEMKMYDEAGNSRIKNAGKFCGAGGDLGGVLSTVADYARFGQMLLNGGILDGVRIISRKSVEIMTSSHTKKLNIPMLGDGYGFGMGVGVYSGGHNPALRTPGTFGWGGAAGTTFFADPKEKLLAICFTQMFAAMNIPGNNYQIEFERLVYQALI
jgi:CubicO group peptidase (beta-lactamase class C family)